MSKEVTIRIWDGCTVKAVFSIGETGSSWNGSPSGAGNSTRPDIEFDPWAGLVVDHRQKFASPVSIWEDQED